MLAALAVWGFSLDTGLPLRILVAIGAPVVAIAIWGRWMAPKSEHQVDDPVRFVVELVLFGFASLGLGLAGYPIAGVVLGGIFLVDRLALMATGGTAL